MVNFPGSRARDVAFDLIRWLNQASGRSLFALSGGLAFDVHGIRLARPLGDIDIAAIERVHSGAWLRQMLAEAGCENLPPARSFAEALRKGCVKFVKDTIDFEILDQHQRAAKASPQQAAAARDLLARCRENLWIINDTPVLDIDAIVAWKAILDRDKDRADIRELATKTRPDGSPAIQNREAVMKLVIDNRGKHAPATEFLDRVMWDQWYRY